MSGSLAGNLRMEVCCYYRILIVIRRGQALAKQATEHPDGFGQPARQNGDDRDAGM